jgi:outer membrane protein
MLCTFIYFMSLQNIKYLFLSILTIGFCSLSYAEGKKIEHIAIVDMQRVEKDSVAVKALLVDLEKKEKYYQDLIKKMENEISNKREEIESKRNIWSSQKIEDERKKAENMINDYQSKVTNFANNMDSIKNSALNEINAIMKDVIGDIGKDQNFDIVMPSNILMYYGDNVSDITDSVVSKLNKKIKKVDISDKK